ncbi:hypothetical protein HDF25_000434 [Pedobacter cryoconitis]|uniref:Uncharacterized protein n=1 Tax=Pedobacter cryoconitis TaxID=188932 RepID=A0A7X0IZI4_9SPHI|nr:hypothetical protein [Pedobacter cryoconitis]
MKVVLDYKLLNFLNLLSAQMLTPDQVFLFHDNELSKAVICLEYT